MVKVQSESLISLKPTISYIVNNNRFTTATKTAGTTNIKKHNSKNHFNTKILTKTTAKLTKISTNATEGVNKTKIAKVKTKNCINNKNNKKYKNSNNKNRKCDQFFFLSGFEYEVNEDGLLKSISPCQCLPNTNETGFSLTGIQFQCPTGQAVPATQEVIFFLIAENIGALRCFTAVLQYLCLSIGEWHFTLFRWEMP